MSNEKANRRLVRMLKEMGTNPDLHPMHRVECSQAAAKIEELSRDLDAMIRQGDDHD